MDPQNTGNTDPRQTLVDKLKQSKSILVTVSANPSVDQLAACLGLTIWLNKADKHATAVFSGEVPSTLEFLQPDDTLEKNTDSLRDFIISLDKTKADKLRYKVEADVVKIFITPYRTSLSADDLEYSQGDFNVDMVVALGVSEQADLDTAVTSHGRILHDATVASITVGETTGQLGSIQWHDSRASSLSEMIVELGNGVDQLKLDNQIATALLTGIVAETQRFSNAKTTPQTMSVSAQLMSAGANQQLVASKLDTPPESEAPADQPVEAAEPDEAAVPSELPVEEPAAPPNPDGALTIDHEDGSDAEPMPMTDVPSDEAPPAMPAESESSDEPVAEAPQPQGSPEEPDMTQPEPTPLAAPQEPSPEPDAMQPAPASWMPAPPWIDPTAPPAPAMPAEPAVPVTPFTPQPDETLTEIEMDVDSPHLAEAEAVEEAERPDLNAARDEVMKAIDSAPPVVAEPIQALNAQPIDLTPAVDNPAELPPAISYQPASPPDMPVAPTTAFNPAEFGLPNDASAPDTMAPSADTVTPTAVSNDTFAAAPPVPPPMMVNPNTVDPDLTTPVEQPFTMPLPTNLTPPPANPVPPTSANGNPATPPLVPPPLPFAAPSQQQK